MRAIDLKKRAFISYRRDDTKHLAGRIADRLGAHPAIDKVFIDVDNIGPGEDFLSKINDSIAVSAYCFVVIGENWLGETKDAEPRIWDRDDFVHMEVHAALHSNCQVIPILAENAAMPSAEKLPENLRALTRLNGVQVGHVNFDLEMQKLLDALLGPTQEEEEGAPEATGDDAPQSKALGEVLRALGGGAVAAAVLLVAAIGHHELSGGRALNETFGSNAAVWMLIAALLTLGAFVPRLMRHFRKKDLMRKRGSS